MTRDGYRSLGTRTRLPAARRRGRRVERHGEGLGERGRAEGDAVGDLVALGGAGDEAFVEDDCRFRDDALRNARDRERPVMGCWSAAFSIR